MKLPRHYHAGPFLTTLGLSIALSLSATTLSKAGKLYKWIDADGNVSYQDSPPPTSAKVLQESTIRKTASQGNGEDQSDVPPLVVYTIDECDGCEMLLLRLQQLQLPFEERSLLSKEIQADILSGNDSLTAPTLRVADKYINDFTEPSFIDLLRDAGYQPKVSQNQLPAASREDPEEE